MGLLAAFIVGALLGWVGTWAIQKRLDDNLTDEVAKLQRQIVEYQRQLDTLQGSAASTASETRAPEAADVGMMAGAVTGAGTAQAAATEAQVVEEVAVEEAGEEAAEQAVEDAGHEGNESPEPEEIELDAETEDRVVEVSAIEKESSSEVVESEQDEVVAEVVGKGAEEEQEQGEPELESATESADKPDDFTQMHGVGPKYAEALNAAGITTYEELANTSPEKLHEYLQPAAWHKVDFEDWIAQAKELAGEA